MDSENTTSTSQVADDANQERNAFMEALTTDNIDRIRSATRHFLRSANSPARAARFIRGAVEKTPPSDSKPFRVALLSSFSIEMIHDPLIAHGYTEGLAVNIYQPGYDQYHQEILAPDSGLYKANSDVIILAVDGPRWAPELYDRFISDGIQRGSMLAETIVARIDDLIAQLRRHTIAPVLLHSMVYPRYPQLGILDATQSDGQRHLLAKVNEGLSTLSREHGAVYLVDMEAIVQSIGYTKWYDGRLDFFARSPIARPAFDTLARYYLRFIRALSGNSAKCLVIDLDNTLWGGIVGEEGPLGIALGSEYPGNAYLAFQRALLTLRDRGIVLAIASKNNIEDVESVFANNPAMLMKPEDFSTMEIHWEAKSISLQRISATLNLGLRHMVFADDNPAECAEVEGAHPSVRVIQLPKHPEKLVDALFSEGIFDTLQLSNEDTRRVELYQQRDAAEKLRTETTSMEDYYQSLQMRIELTSVTRSNLARASQMTRKTTQFNTTTRCYAETELDLLRQDKDWKTLTMRVIDRFGDNGIVGLMLAKRVDDHYNIDTMLMSCRVINRGVETAMLHWLEEEARVDGMAGLEGWIFPTSRNVPVRDLYKRHGFSIVETDIEGTRWRLNLSGNSVDVPNWLKIINVIQE